VPAFRKNLDILYVGTLPPHPGGTAISLSQLLIGFAELGHAIRAVAPMTAEASLSGDAFAHTYPYLGVKRFLVPYFETETSPNAPRPTSESYRRLQHERIHAAHTLEGAVDAYVGTFEAVVRGTESERRQP
jgi:hypothetical protein